MAPSTSLSSVLCQNTGPVLKTKLSAPKTSCHYAASLKPPTFRKLVHDSANQRRFSQFSHEDVHTKGGRRWQDITNHEQGQDQRTFRKLELQARRLKALVAAKKKKKKLFRHSHIRNKSEYTPIMHIPSDFKYH